MGESLQKGHFCIINKTMTVCWGGTVVKQLECWTCNFTNPWFKFCPHDSYLDFFSIVASSTPQLC